MIVGVGGIVYSLGQSLFEEYKFNKNKNDKPTYLGGWKDNSLYVGKYLYVYLSKEKGQWKTKGKLAGVKEGVYLVGKDAVEWPDYKTAKEQIALKWAKILKVPFKENEKQEKLLS
jgi:hypothetical protein